MSSIYRDVDTLDDQPKVGNGDCVDLIKAFAPGLKETPTIAWKQGAPVLDSPMLARGTAITTFEQGRNRNRPTGNHAAFFLQHAGAGFWVMDQWKRKGVIGKRYISRGKKNKDGTYVTPSDNAFAFSVIER